MLNRMTILALRFLSRPPITHPFPFRHMPQPLSEGLAAAESGKREICPPLEAPERYRGKIAYDRSACIGCRLCIKVCPANAIRHLPEEKKVEIRTDRCCFCEQCTEICPVKCLWMTREFLIVSAEGREEARVTDSGPRPK